MNTGAGQDCEYIVVGGGTAGCIAAWRLLTETDARVVLLESGADYTSPYLKLSPGYSRLVPKGVHCTLHQTVPQCTPAIESSKSQRGGCSEEAAASMRRSTCAATRPIMTSGDRLPGSGLWSWATMLPHFRRLEEQSEVQRRVSWLRRSADGRGSRFLLRVQPPFRQGRANARPAIPPQTSTSVPRSVPVTSSLPLAAVDVAVSRRHFLAGCDRIRGSAS